MMKPIISSILATMLAFSNGAHSAPPTFPNPGFPVKLIVPFAAGGGSDILARLYGTRLSERLGVPVVVENKPGAGGMIGSAQVAKASPDGHTVLVTVTSLLQAPSLYKNVGYDPLKDFKPVHLMARVATGFIVRSDFPAGTIQEFAAELTKKPEKYALGNYGPGTLSHIQNAVLLSYFKVGVPQAAYAGAPPLLRAVIGGEVAGAFTDIQSSLPQVASGRIKVLGVSGTQQVGVLPKVPAIGSTIPSLDLSGWIGVFLPSGTPDLIAERLAAELERISQMPDVMEKMQSLSFTPGQLDRPQFTRMVATDYERWTQLIKAQGITVE